MTKIGNKDESQQIVGQSLLSCLQYLVQVKSSTISLSKPGDDFNEEEAINTTNTMT